MGDAKAGFKKAGSSFTTVETDLLQMQTDPTGPFYDKRVVLPVLDADVKNIVALGVRVPVEVSSFENALWVIDGRQRYKCWLEAVKAWEKIGEPIKPLPVIIRQTKPDDGEFISISLNEHRQNDDLMAKIERAARNISLGHDAAEVANAFGITPNQLKNWLKSDSLCPAVKKKVASGEISVTAASKFADLPKDEQIAKVEELIAAPEKPTVERAAKIASGKKPAKKGLSKAAIDDIYEADATPEEVKEFIDLLYGDKDASEVSWIK